MKLPQTRLLQKKNEKYFKYLLRIDYLEIKNIYLRKRFMYILLADEKGIEKSVLQLKKCSPGNANQKKIKIKDSSFTH